MAPRCARLILGGLLLLVSAQIILPRPGLAAANSLAHAIPWRQAQATLPRGSNACAARLAEGVGIAEAWGWTLCFDSGILCELTLSMQRQRAMLRGWLTCATRGAGP